MYNYMYTITQDVINVITYGADGKIKIADEYEPREGETRDEYAERLEELLFTDDNVTGNGSGSYTFWRDRAKEIVLDNLDLVQDMTAEGLTTAAEVLKDMASEDWEKIDVMIRCFLLPGAIDAALDEIDDLAELYATITGEEPRKIIPAA